MGSDVHDISEQFRKSKRWSASHKIKNDEKSIALLTTFGIFLYSENNVYSAMEFSSATNFCDLKCTLIADD